MDRMKMFSLTATFGDSSKDQITLGMVIVSFFPSRRTFSFCLVQSLTVCVMWRQRTSMGKKHNLVLRVKDS